MNNRRLLTYLLIDTSGSMQGEPIEAVNTGLGALLSALRQNPYALETVHLNITTFDSEIKEVLPLTPLENVQLPTIQCPRSGATLLGEALKHIVTSVKANLRPGTPEAKGDWAPMLIVLTDGKTTDLLEYQEATAQIQALGFGNIVACAAGPKADPSQLKALTDTVVSLDTMDARGFSAFFQWVSEAVGGKSTTIGAGANNDLPPPPAEINVVL
ncbi:vWA domain-containing protein [Suttonella ornithocola]|uniref:Uncharacterized protein encoded in toxicity protection region of plasmid R478, contains von Willebrand factor (VWF) domain n=1 Tax=Suttonella ornithocola TaxID=279832 RepID=A0A380MQX5_9GAMM|nr:VWA domain-containing protein [Suttonella ornithocola]SUO94313.1 Uncharacterized protein encoded in toxicity protection region of plasmid R478, contains von Willebrand factor (vWF) domain [Suttonella ornithocola]